MNNKILLIVGAIALLGALFFLGIRSQKSLESNLPPKEICSSQIEAQAQAIYFMTSDIKNRQVISVLGTGSMQPYIKAAQPNEDPYKTVVAYVVIDKSLQYKDLEVGQLVCYHPAFDPKQTWLHLAASKDSTGWIMTGLNNKHYENWMRVTDKNFVGIVIKTFTW